MTHDMDAKYGHTEQRNCEAAEQRSSEAVGKVLASTRQALSRLMSMLRVCLEYAKSMARVWLEYVFVRRERTLSPSRTNSQSVPYVLKTMLVLLMMVLGTSGTWGQTTYTYYALHNKDKGYLKQYKGIVGNDGTFRYDNTHADNGSSIWVYSSDGYLQQEMYYLNVLNEQTLVLSTTPVTQWDLVTDGDKKRFQLHESTKILGFDGSKVVLAESPTYKYAACTLEVTENSGKWEGPKDVSWEVQSPQLVTYLCAYYLRNITVKIVKNDEEKENVQVVDNKDSRAHCSLTYDNSQTDPSGRGNEWDINTTTGVIYNRTSSQKTVAAKYTLTPLDPKVLAAYPATTTTVTIKVNAKALVPDATKKNAYGVCPPVLC